MSATRTKSFFIPVVLLISVVVFLFVQACDSPDPTGPAADGRMTMTATDTEIPADGSTTTLITAVIKDPLGNAAAGPVYWETTCGSLDKSSETIEGGVSSVTLQAPNYPCIAVVTADAVHVKKSISITCYSVDAYTISVTANPREIPADGYSSTTISAVVTDERGLSVPDGTSVNFSTTGGTLAADTVTTESGRASVLLTSETVPKDAKVTATVGSASGSAWVRFYSTQVGRIILEAFPDSNVPANGTNSVLIIARVYDVNSNPVEDGTIVNFTADRGTIDPSQAATGKGIAETDLRTEYSTTGYRDRITAQSGGASHSITIDFIPATGPPKTPPTFAPTMTPTPIPTNFPTLTPTPTGTTIPTLTPTPIFTPTPVPNTNTPNSSPVPPIPTWYVFKENDTK